MRLSNKVLLALGLVWLLFLILFYISANQFLMKSFLKLETTEIHKNIQRVHQAIDQVSYALGTFTIDWAHWNDAYDFIEGKHRSFVSDNLDITALNNSNINLLIYLNKKGQILVGTASDGKQLLAYPKGIEKFIYPGSILEKHTNPESNIRGMIALPSDIMLIAAAGISHTDLSRPINGTLITGRFFTKELLEDISSATRLNLSLYPMSQIEGNQQLKSIFMSAIQSTAGDIIRILNDEWAEGYTTLRDIYKNPIGMIKLKVPRTIYLTGKETIDYYIAVFIISGVFLALLIWYMLRVLVLIRIESLNKTMQKIARDQNIEPVAMTKGDEISSLAFRFDKMMQIILNSYEQMKQNLLMLSRSEKNLANTNKKLINEINDRIQAQDKAAELHNKLLLSVRRAGVVDITRGVLYSVKNILTSVTNSISLIKEKIEASKNKTEKLVDSLKQSNKSDNLSTIEPTVTHLINQWESDNKGVLKEITDLEENILSMKNMIKMQHSLSTVSGSVEEVSPKRLIADALVLHKTSLDKSNIEVTTDYEFTGKLIIDRVKVLHVLVSLIKNSIDSLKESNNEQKKIIINIKKKDEEHIIINVIDNGIGIAPENLEKIFTFGFTTKGKGHGYALHASETFVHDIGGNVRVESAGFNKGATFTLILPMHSIDESELKKLHITRERT